MTNQRSPEGVAVTGELRTTTTAANQVLATADVMALFAKSWDTAIFKVRGEALSFEEAGGNNYTGFAEILAKAVRRGGTLTITNAIDPNNDTIPILNLALSAINFNVSGNTIQLRITPLAGNIRHYGLIEIEAYEYT
jgi:hypothetical protein